MTIHDEQDRAGGDQLLDARFAIQVLIEINEVAAFVEFNKGAGNWLVGFGLSFDIPAVGFGSGAVGGGGVESHGAAIDGATGEKNRGREQQHNQSQDAYDRIEE